MAVNFFDFDEDVTSWDFWKRNEENRHIPDDPDPRDLGSSFYDADLQSWVARPSWTYNQAAALCFGKCPDRIEWDDDLPADIEDGLEDPERERRSVFLRFAIAELSARIQAAQALKILQLDIKPSDFAAWARLFRIAQPAWGPIPKQLKHAEAFEVVTPGLQRTSDLKKRLRNLQKIILALVLMPRTPPDLADLARNIERKLNELNSDAAGDKSVTYEHQSVLKSLKEALDLLENPEEHLN